MMANETISLIPEILKEYKLKTLDITGGAPEMHPGFKELILNTKGLNIQIIDRCNLTILLEPNYIYLPEFLAENKIKIIASLPCYEEGNVDHQRGRGVFQKSIEALKILNKLGYGLIESGLELDLVYNPQGDSLPPSQSGLQEIYKEELLKRHGIRFNKLLVITNMPIKRFATQLDIEGKLISYKSLLKDNYNSSNLDSIMCLETISVDWQGYIFDCDFNQQLRYINTTKPYSLKELLKEKVKFEGMPIAVAEHCFGCTAGSGSSCGGSLN